MTRLIDSTRRAIVDAILAEPWESCHRYALADTFVEVGDGDGHAIDDLRNDAGMWVILWYGGDYRMVWVARCRQVDLVPACHRGGVQVDRPAINVARVPRVMVPVCHTSNGIPTYHDLGCPINRCAKDGQCKPRRRVASRHSGWRWYCPGGYARIGAPCVQGVYLA